MRSQTLLMLCLIAVSGCKGGSLPTQATATSTTTTSAPAFGTAPTVTISPSTFVLSVNQSMNVQVSTSSSQTGAFAWKTADTKIATVTGDPNPTRGLNSETGKLTCVANGKTTLTVTFSPLPLGNDGTGTAPIVCGTGVPDGQPPITPTDVVGTYTKKGTRTDGSNCSPPVFGSSFQAGLVVEQSADGNKGVRFIEAHTGTNAAGPFLINLFYSQFDVEQKPNGLLFDSGFPVRDVLGRTFTTHISLFFAADGTILGTETFESEGPPPCKDTYVISGERAK